MLTQLKTIYESILNYYLKIPKSGRNTIHLVTIFTLASTAVIILNDQLSPNIDSSTISQNFNQGNAMDVIIRRDTIFKCDTIIKLDTIYNKKL